MPINDDPKPWPPISQLWERTHKRPDGCWEWVMHRRADTPLQMRWIWQGRIYNPRRLMWELMRSHKPRFLLRLCNTEACINPDHHEERVAVRHCKRGHLLVGDNLYIRPGNGQRSCRTCTAMRQNTPEQIRRKLERQKTFRARWDAEQHEQSRQVKRRSDDNQRLARQIDRDHAYWSPSAQRWMVNEGHRWIKGADQDVRAAIKTVLAEHNQLPQGDHERTARVRDMMRRLRRLRPNIGEEAA